MIDYSTTQLITDTELEYIDTLSDKSTFFKTTGRQYSVYELNDYDKNIFLTKVF